MAAVHLTRIYTKTGDAGTTALGDGSRVAKTDPRIAAYADADECNAAIGVALLVTVAFSLSLGWRAGLLHLAAVGCCWLYNAWLKATWLSWLPYAAAFGALPAIATLALPTHPAPAAWVVAAGAAFGVAANLTNALPDLADDRLTGVAGLPHRIGTRASFVSRRPPRSYE